MRPLRSRVLSLLLVLCILLGPVPLMSSESAAAQALESNDGPPEGAYLRVADPLASDNAPFALLADQPPDRVRVPDPPLPASDHPPAPASLPSPLEFEPGLPVNEPLPRRLPHHGLFPVAQWLAEELRAEAEASASELPEQHFITPEIEALAQGLDDDPVLIYNYVHDRIEYVPTHGLLKAPRETLLSGVGSGMDQAALLVALMRAAGHAVRYINGIAVLSFEQAMNWTGVATPDLAVELFEQGGLNVNMGNNYVAIIHVWTELQVDSEWLPLDPSFKRYETSEGIDLAPILGYERSAFLSAAQSGATITSNCLQGLNGANIRARLEQYSRNLISYLDQNAPFAAPDEIIVRRQIVPQNLTALPDELPYTVYGDATPFDTFSTHLQYGLRIEMPGAEYLATMSSVSGERLTLFFEPATETDRQRINAAGGIYGVYPAYEVNMVPLLRLGGQTVATGLPIELGGVLPVTVSLQAPWRTDEGQLYFQPSSSEQLSVSASVALVTRLQRVSAAQIGRQQQRLAVASASGQGDQAEPVLGEALNVLGLSYYQQNGLAEELLAQIADVKQIDHFALAWIKQGVSVEVGITASAEYPLQVSLGAPGVDIFLEFYGAVSRQGNVAARDAWDFADGGVGSAMEHGVLEQLQDVASVSTIQVLRLANAARQRIYHITSDNVDAVLPHLDYGSAEVEHFRDLVEDDYEVIVPQQEITYNQWTGTGWVERHPGGLGQGHLILGGMAGGGGTEPRTVQLDGMQPDIWRVPLAGVPDDPSITEPMNPRNEADPVDPATGTFLHAEDDFAFGALGFPISFRRSYASSRLLIDGPLGPGWTHSYDMRAVQSSDWARVLGGGTAVDAAAAIVYGYVSSDIGWMAAADLPWERIVIASEMAHWLMSQLTDNAVLVTDHRGSLHSYVLLPDGSYRPGTTTYSRLTPLSGGGYTLQGKDGSRLEFDGDGRLESLSDADGNRTALTYSGSGALTQVTDPAGRQIALSYANGRLVRVSDPLGGEYQYSYDGSGRLSSCTDPSQQVTQYGYDAKGRLSSITDPEGQTYVSCTYDDLGRVSTQTNGLGGQVTFGYGGDRTVVTNANGARAVYHYDRHKRLIALDDPLGQRQSMTHDGKGNPLTMTDERGNTMRFTYDAHGNLTGVTNPLGETMAYQYDSADNLTRLTDALGHVWSFQYDARHHLTRTTDPLAHTTQYAYSGRGQLTRATDANGHATTLSYETAGNLERITMPLGQATAMAYDGLGRVVGATDPNGDVTQYEYDEVGNLVRVTDAAGGVTRAEYDGNGLLVRVIDALGNATRYEYDAQLNLTSITDPLGRAQRFAYDAVGNLVRRTKADGQQISYQYDDASRLVRADYADGSHADYAYDAAGNVTRLARGSWEERRSYDDAGRLISVSYPSANVTLTCQFDAAGRRSQLTVSRGAVAMLQWSYGYDDANRQLTIANVTSGQTTRLQYDAASNLTAVIHPNTARSNYTYNANGRLTRADALDGTGRSVVRWDYAYDPSGNPTRVTETRSGRSYTIDYTYDANGQLTREGHARYDVTYQYDAAGNRAQMTAPWGTVDYTYDLAGQLLAAGSRTFSYDTNGNLTQETGAGRTVAYAWDAEDRLTSVTLPGGVGLKLEYDALGRPIREVLGDRVQYRLYDGSQIVLESEDVFQSGVAYPSLGGRLVARVPFGVTEVQAVGYHSDGWGSIRLLSDGSGVPRDAYAHDAFGYPQAALGADANPYRFVGEWGVRALPAPAGLYQMGFRFYDASSGRFLSRDLLVGGLGTPLSTNPYVYALNSPLHYVDPSGLRPSADMPVERATKRLTDAIVAWAAAPGPQGFDPVEYALRLTFYRQAAQQRIRELQRWLLQPGRQDEPPSLSGPGHARPEVRSRLLLTESIKVLQKVLDNIDDILGGQIWR